jgi:hypothetical protein
MSPAARKSGNSDKTHTTEFELERETKGAVRFQEVPPDGQEAHVRSIYFRKELWEQLGKPEVIEMSIKAAS